MIGDVARGDIEKRHVAAVAVHQQDLAKAMMGQALPDVGDVVDEGGSLDGDGAGEVEVVLVEGVLHRR